MMTRSAAQSVSAVPRTRRCLIVTASQWPTHAALARLFAQAGFEVTLLGTRRSLGRSRFVTAYVDAPSDPDQVTTRLRDYLREAGSRYQRIVVCDENVLRLAAERFTPEELAGWYPVPPERAAIIASKDAFLAAAAREGVPTTETVLCAAPNDAHAAAARLGFPLVAKSAHGHGGSGIARLDSGADIDAIPASSWPALVQPLLVGEPGTTEVIFSHGVPVRWLCSEMLDCYPPPFGPSSSRRMIDMPEMEAILRAIGRATGFDGVGGVDWFLDRRTGRIDVLELNPRPQTCYDLSPRTRDAFARALRQLADGEPVMPSGAIAPDGGTAVPQFPQHLYHALFQPGLSPLRRAERSIATLRRADFDDMRVTLAHGADVMRWIYGFSPLATMVRALKRSSLGRSLKTRVRRRRS